MKRGRTVADGRGRWLTIATPEVARGLSSFYVFGVQGCLLLLLAGCASTAPTETNHVADSGASVAGQTLDAQKTSGLPEPIVKVVGNPSRVYQLKDLKKTDLVLNGHTVHAWVMNDEPKQAEGMMFLTDKEVKPDEVMLFAFPDLQRKADNRSFWMHNTLIPLDIVYIAPTGKVLNVGHGKVQDDSPVLTAGDYQNVIELKAGTAARYGLKPGDMVKIPKI